MHSYFGRFLFFLLFPFLVASQTIYQRDRITIIADSFHQNNKFKEALPIRLRAIDTNKNAPLTYRNYLNAKYYHTLACNYESESYQYHNRLNKVSKEQREELLRQAIAAINKAREAYPITEDSDKLFQYNLQNRIYHEKGYLGEWKDALKEAYKGYSILKDTLGEKQKKMVDLIYDIGYIYSQMGDYTAAVQKYQQSLDLYRNIIGEMHTDVAQAYQNISKEYKNLGLRKKELESLLKAKVIWETLDREEDFGFLYQCYGNLSDWYSYYGDFHLAEYYMNKRTRMFNQELNTRISFLRNKEEIYEQRLEQWFLLMNLALAKEDSLNVERYLDSLDTYTNSGTSKWTKFEVKYKSAALAQKAALHKKKDAKKALFYLNRAIALLDGQQHIFYTDPLPLRIKKAEVQFYGNDHNTLEKFLKELQPAIDSTNTSEQFVLRVLQGKNNASLGHLDQAGDAFDQALRGMMKNPEQSLENFSSEDLIPMVSFESIDGFLAMGDFYFNSYKKRHDKSLLNKAFKRYTLASEVFSKIYLGQRFNRKLYEVYSAINKGLLECALEPGKDQFQRIVAALNAVENNGSKLTWTKFISKVGRKSTYLPQELLDDENATRAQLQFYQKKLYSNDHLKEGEKEIWALKVDSLSLHLQEIQDTIQKSDKRYADFNSNSFSVFELQHEIEPVETLWRFVLTEESLYRFDIRKNSLTLRKIGKTRTILDDVQDFVKKLSSRAPMPEEDSLYQKLCTDYPPDMDGTLHIIPDGPLHYLPFESLFWDRELPVISYSPSLLLYLAQTTQKAENINATVGAFALSQEADNNGKTLNRLPYTLQEIDHLLSAFKGKKFLDPSKKDFLENAPLFPLLHLATHSILDKKNPEFSHLMFRDGPITINELYNLHLQARLVVLSSCDTGAGSMEEGEGVISISRAFTYAGVPSTVMSLWEVEDAATSKLMAHFYFFLNRGYRKDEALRLAKMSYLEETSDPLLRHPYYWSGFIISGNTDPVTTSPKHHWLYVIPVLVLLGFGFYKRTNSYK